MLLMRFPGGKRKAFTLSYDDAMHFDRQMIEILNKYGIKCTFFILIRHLIEESEGEAIIFDEMEALYKGHEIGGHTITHSFMGYAHASEAMRDIFDEKRILEQRLGRIIYGFGYPDGCYNAETVEILKNAGYHYARNSASSYSFKMPKNWLEWNATCHHNDPRLMELAKAFVENERPWGSVDVFHVRGHSYEFDRDNNWELLEELCKYMANHDDIWYATNGEIRRQVKIFENLEVSADGKRIYNPSAESSWVEIETGGKIIEIKGGEAVTI